VARPPLAAVHPGPTPARWLFDHAAGRPLLGIGPGGAGALRLAFQYPHLFPAVASVNGLDAFEAYGHGTPLDDLYASREHCRQDAAILHIHPSRYPAHIWLTAPPGDRCYRGFDRLREKLTALGIAHEAPENGTVAAAVAFLKQAQAKISRRLV